MPPGVHVYLANDKTLVTYKLQPSCKRLISHYEQLDYFILAIILLKTVTSIQTKKVEMSLDTHHFY